MKHLDNGRYLRNCRLFFTIWDEDKKKVMSQRKRLSNDLPLWVHQMQREVEEPSVVNYMMWTKNFFNCKITEAKKRLDPYIKNYVDWRNNG